MSNPFISDFSLFSVIALFYFCYWPIFWSQLVCSVCLFFSSLIQLTVSWSRASIRSLAFMALSYFRVLLNISCDSFSIIFTSHSSVLLHLERNFMLSMYILCAVSTLLSKSNIITSTSKLISLTIWSKTCLLSLFYLKMCSTFLLISLLRFVPIL